MALRRGTALIIAVALCGALPATAAPATETASGSSYAKKIKKLLRDRFSTTGVTSVTCPARVRVRTGYVFTCRSSWRSGDSPKLRVRIRNSSGNFTVRPTTVPMRHLEDDLAMLLSEDNLTGDVTCPGSRVTRKGDQFTCTVAFTNGATGAFDVTQIGDGRVTQRYRTISGDPEPSAGQPPPA